MDTDTKKRLTITILIVLPVIAIQYILFSGDSFEKILIWLTNNQEKPLPYDQAKKITGRAGLDMFGNFSGKAYNGSAWTVTRLVLRIDAQGKDGSTEWSRDFSADVNIKSLKTEYFSVTVLGERGVTVSSWNIKEIYGYKE